MQPLKHLFPLFILLILIACTEGPLSKKQLAVQGLLSADLTPNGSAAVIGSIHHGGSFWNLKKKERLFDWNHAKGEMSSIRASSVSGDGSKAVTCVEDNMVLWDTATGQYKQFWQSSSRIESISLNKDGSKALMGLKDGTVSYFDMNRGSPIYNFKHNAEVRSTDLSEDGSLGISGSDDNTAKIWNLKTGKVLHTIKLKNQIKTVAISASGQYVFTTAQREDAIVWITQTAKEKLKLKNRYTNFTTATFSKNDKHLILGTFQGEIKRISIKSGKELNTWQASPRKSFGGASSKAILALAEHKKKVTAITSDGMMQTFKP